jgi:hypothetical protein
MRGWISWIFIKVKKAKKKLLEYRGTCSTLNFFLLDRCPSWFGTNCVTPAGLTFVILLPQSPWGWDYCCAPPHPITLTFFFFCSSEVWIQGLHLEPLHRPFFVKDFFRDRVSQTVCLDWPRTMILLIMVYRITGVSHERPANQWSWALYILMMSS